MLADGIERLLESQAALKVDFVDQFFKLLFGCMSDRSPGREEFGPLFQFILFGNGVHIDVAKALNLLAKLADFFAHRGPIHFAGLISVAPFFA